MVDTFKNANHPTGAPSGAPVFVRPTYASTESMLLYDSLVARIEQLEQMVIDHEQRFDTLQTPFWKRFWFWIDGWPWYDLNGSQRRRPWHRRR